MTPVRIGELQARGVAELTTGPFGTQLSADQYSSTGTPVINVRNVGFGDIRTASLEFLPEEHVERLARHQLQEGDIVFARKGAVDRHALITSSEAGWIQGSDCIRLRLDPDVVDPRFVSFALRTEWHQRWMQNYCSFGATMASLNQEILALMEIPFPAIDDQRSIACELGMYDDLIKNNRRQIEVLEGMARLLYREWFVYFRYPGHEDVELVDSGLGPIPEGWAWRNLFDLAEVGFGFSFKSKQFAESGSIRVVRIRDVPKNTTRTYTNEDPGERYEIHDGDTLIGMDGDFHMCRWAGGLAHLNQRVARLRSKGSLSQLHLHLALEQPIQEFNRTIIGTTVAHLGKRHLEEIFIAEPPSPVLASATERFQPIFELELNIRKQNRVLHEARDLLLPRLVSGELDVSELGLGLVAV